MISWTLSLLEEYYYVIIAFDATSYNILIGKM